MFFRLIFIFSFNFVLLYSFNAEREREGGPKSCGRMVATYAGREKETIATRGGRERERRHRYN